MGARGREDGGILPLGDFGQGEGISPFGDFLVRGGRATADGGSGEGGWGDFFHLAISWAGRGRRRIEGSGGQGVGRWGLREGGGGSMGG
ncbi:hypothetical protein TIFTF001_012589 [Ficus carica]|uniref:Uncharacterized protein n=1 Tax=Ficus carica TaxID=3494 RepID=A0AA88DI37_FICCA|nr:hypothetical protein TIFTF001_012589 [Ficus carica]